MRRLSGLALLPLVLVALATNPPPVPARQPPPAEVVAIEADADAEVASETGDHPELPGSEVVDVAGDEPSSPAQAESPEAPAVWGDRFAVSGDVVVPSDAVRRGDLVSIGGTVRVDGTLRGSVTVIGGEAIVNGEVSRDVVAVFSAVELGDAARVEGSVVNVLGSLDDRGAAIRRDLVDIPLGLRWPGLEGPLQVLATLWLWSKLVLIVLVFLGILVLTALAPERVERLAGETARRPWIALAIGIPTFLIGVPAILLLLAVSVVGLIVLPIAVLAIAVLIWLGYAGLFLHVGRRIGRTLGREMSVLGGMLLGFLVFAVLWFVPLFGSIVWTVLTWTATGIVITGRLGAPPRPPTLPPVSTGPPAGGA